MVRDFYPMLEGESMLEVQYPARIAVYDDAAAAPRVCIIDPADVRTYLDEITKEVSRLSHEQGGSIPFMVIREIVENYIHALFISPTISVLDGGNTLRFSDQGPGIVDKDLAMEYGTSSATEEMKRFIRGVGSGLPYVQQYMTEKGGSLTIEDNIGAGTVVTLTATKKEIPTENVGQERVIEKHPAVYESTAQLSQRASLVIDYLKEHEFVGSSDLARLYHLSAPTWTRELKVLAQDGIITKRGQKYMFTQYGKSLYSDTK